MKTFTLTITLILAGVLEAQAAPSMVARFDAWGVYSYKANGRTVCYALSVPAAAKPSNVNHGDNFLLVAPSEGRSRAFEPQAAMGYALKPGSIVRLTLGDKTFRLIPQGKTAWIRNLARGPELIKAMRAGSTLTLNATSARGTETTYTYSLAGVTAALNHAAKCR